VSQNRLTTTVHELGPGQRAAPYHYHHGNEEWVLVLEGHPTIRDLDGEHRLDPGDVACFPRGPGGAHELRNADTEVARVLVLATSFEPSVTHYPNDGTLRVTPPGKLFREADAIASESD
jgi:uncharacterized cupin superfamily protein